MVKHTQTIRRPINCLSVFDHFEGLELKVLIRSTGFALSVLSSIYLTNCTSCFLVVLHLMVFFPKSVNLYVTQLFDIFNFIYSCAENLTDCRDFKQFYGNRIFYFLSFIFYFYFLFGFHQLYFIAICTTTFMSKLNKLVTSHHIIPRNDKGVSQKVFRNLKNSYLAEPISVSMKLQRQTQICNCTVMKLPLKRFSASFSAFLERSTLQNLIETLVYNRLFPVITASFRDKFQKEAVMNSVYGRVSIFSLQAYDSTKVDSIINLFQIIFPIFKINVFSEHRRLRWKIKLHKRLNVSQV